MRPIDVVLAHSNPEIAAELAAILAPEFRTIVTVSSVAEMRYAVPRLRASVALVDLELMAVQEIGELCHDFPATAFVCLHRLADERMWSESLANGAADCCQSNDIQSILHAADRHILHHPARASIAVA